MSSKGLRRLGRLIWTGLLAIGLVLAGGVAYAYTPPANSPFTDVTVNDEYYTEIAWMWESGISTGWPDGTYRPNQQVDRDAMAAFFYRYRQSPPFTAPSQSPFTDINPTTQFYKEMAWMKQTGISTGWPDGTYRPWDTTYRDAMSAFMYRVAGEPAYTPPAVSPFSDIDPGIQFYKEMMWMAENGIANNIDDGTFDPWDAVTREMMAVFMYRLANPSDTPAELRVATTSLPAGAVGHQYSTQLAAFGGSTPYQWSATGLPEGLSISADGQISGVPTQKGTATVNITVTDANATSASATLSLTVTDSVDPLVITTTSLPGGVVGSPYTATLSAEGGVQPYAWTATGLPNGLRLSSQGQISGTPTAASTSRVTFTATDSVGTAVQTTLTIAITTPLTVVTNALPNSVVGIPYSATVVAQGGVSPYSWTASGLPSGLSISNSGQISGTPRSAGTSSVALKVTDSAGTQATRTLSLTIAAEDDCDVLKCIALTFDDGPGAYNDSLVNSLTRANATATFFDVGSRVRGNLAATGRKAAAGMEIGIHGWDHIDYTAMGYGYISYDLDAAAQAVEDATGTWPTLFRPPYGFYSNDVINAAGDLGMATVLWTDNTWDYEYTNATTLRWDTVDMASRNAVLLMHDDIAATNSALPGIISDLQAEGYTLVTITQMLGRLDTHVLHFDP